MGNIPSGWANITIEDVAEVNPRKSINLSPEDAVTFVPMAAVSEVSGTIENPTDRPLKEVNKGFTQFIDNDVIFAKITPSMENGKAAVARGLTNGFGFGSTEFHVFRSKGPVLPDFLWHYIRQKKFRDNARNVMSGAVGQQRVPADYLKSHGLLLPPLAEQERIVKKVDDFIARTTRARSELANIPSLIAKYKSAVLEMAFSGRMTADLRNGDKNDVGSLPRGWNLQLLGNISEIQGGIQVGKRRTNRGELVEVPYLRVANVQRGWLNLEEVKYIFVTHEEKARLLLADGDILMNEGGDRDKLGRGWVWNGQVKECIHQNHVFRIRLNADTLPPEFVSHYANERGQQYFFNEGTQTTNLASISKRKVSALPLPVPPLKEAVEIVKRIRIAFAWLDRIGASQTVAFQALSKLEIAILDKAFCGKLVAQNANDEPASSVLRRTREEWSASLAKTQERSPLRKKRVKETPMPSEKKLEQVLTEAGDWISAQIAFQRCGVSDGASTEQIEKLYGELRELDISGMLEVEAVNDDQERKLFDRIRLRTV